MQWKDVIGYHGIYEVSSTGLVRAVKPRRKDKQLLRLSKGRDGYLRINLSKDSKHKKWPVHRLVAMAFIANPKNRPINNHLNGIRDDNRIENLEWCNHSENNVHAFRVLGRKHSGGCLPRPVIAIFKNKEIRFNSITEAALLGFYESGIKRCADGIQKKHKHVVWRYI